ncbi:MAG: glycerophosphodiester phosphodiesterase [Lysobacterales bacterium]
MSFALAACASVPQHGAEAMKPFTVIAHRGAAGYLPEHSLEGVAMAHAMGADYIEQDVVLSRDGSLIVLHDLHLDAVTDVAEQFPGRAREDGHFYALDFDLPEIRRLRLHERTEPDGAPAFRGRFPPEQALFRVPTLEEEIRLIQGLNRSTGRNVGLYVEPKSPAWHAVQGHDLVARVLAVLDAYGYAGPEDAAILQSFDRDALLHARHELKTRLRLMQLIGENSWDESPTDFEQLRTEAGLANIATYADGIGPWIPQVIEFHQNDSSDISDLTRLSRENGLFVHAYTLRADRLPPGATDFDQVISALSTEAGIDGVFTDHPDRATRYLDIRRRQK